MMRVLRVQAKFSVCCAFNARDRCCEVEVLQYVLTGIRPKKVRLALGVLFVSILLIIYRPKAYNNSYAKTDMLL
jgi:hypothetical protein